MPSPLALLPDFLLIALGFVLCRRTSLDRAVWDAAERLVYWLLFPVLLFTSIARSPLQGAQLVAAASVGTVGVGIALAAAVRLVPGVDPRLHASGAQTVFRFNSYIGLALAERVGGAAGVAAMALVIALVVPLCNVAAVWPLARHGGHAYGRELLRNPLILSTVGGLVANLAGLRVPDALGTALQRIGVAALPIGLMAVGAGLQLGRLAAAPSLAAAFLALRHLAMPLVALGFASALALPSASRAIVLLFAALPTSAASYVLAARMGGDGGFVAGLVTLSTLLAMVGIPLWLALAAALP
jgi:predicted permease